MIPQKPSRRSEPVGLAVLAVTAADPVAVRPTSPTLLVPIESSVVTALVGRVQHVVDRSAFVVAAAGARMTLRVAAGGARVAMLTLHEPALAQMVRSYRKLDVRRARLDAWLARTQLLPRTVWVHEIVHRYVFERNALDEHDNDAVRFLQTEIVKELYFLFRDRDEGVDRATILHEHTACVERAVAFIEAHLFAAGSVAALARHAGASESTLLRAFRRELGCTPATYWRRRKQDEALEMLRAGRLSVAETAARVGYDNATAFSHAFRQRFGRPPSSFRPRAPQRPAP